MGTILVDNGRVKTLVVSKQGIPGSGVSDAQLTAAITAHETADPAHPASAISGLGDAATQDALDLPVSVWQQDALDLKADQAAVDLKADKSELDPPIWIVGNGFDAVMPDTSARPTQQTIETATAVNRRAWRLEKAAASARGVGTQRVLPEHWNTYNVDAYWTRLGGESAGNVRLQWLRTALLDGGDATAAVIVGTSLTRAAPAQNTLDVFRLATSVSYDQGSVEAIFFNRVGNSGLDTFTGAVHLLAVRLTKAT